MKDFDKIKEKSKKDEFKGILGLGLIFLIAVGVIVYILINLTNQYFSLKNQLDESKEEKKVTMTVPDEGSTYEYTINKKKIKKVTQEEKEINKIKKKNTEAKESNGTITENKITDKAKNDNVTKKKIVENKKATKEPVITEKKEVKAVTQPQVKSNKKSMTKAKINYEYAVQLMAFQNKSDAEKQVNKLKKQVNDIYIMKADLGKKGVWYRVRCCKSQTKQEASKKSKALDKKLNIKSIIVRY